MESWQPDVLISGIDHQNEPIFWLTDGYVGNKLDKEEIKLENYLLISMAAFGIVSNLFVMIVTCCSRTLMRCMGSYLILSLGMADLLLCGGVLLLTPFVRNIVLVKWCPLWYFLTTFACTSSSLNICAIAFDRYVFIVQPFSYEKRMSRPKIIGMMLLVWMLAGLFGSLAFLLDPTHNHKKMNMTSPCHVPPEAPYALGVVVTVLFVPILISIVLYVNIFQVLKTVRRDLKRIEGLRAHHFFPPGSGFPSWTCSIEDSQCSSPGAETPKGSLSKKADRHVSQSVSVFHSIASWGLHVMPPNAYLHTIIEDIKGYVVLSLVLGTYILCWMPFAVYVLLENTIQLPAEKTGIRRILLYLGCSNSCWNPLLYGGLNPVFRKALMRKCCRGVQHRRRRSRELRRRASSGHQSASHTPTSPELLARQGTSSTRSTRQGTLSFTSEV